MVRSHNFRAWIEYFSEVPGHHIHLLTKTALWGWNVAWDNLHGRLFVLLLSHFVEEQSAAADLLLLDTGGPVGHLEKTIDRVLRRETAARNKAVGRN
jgi:hypothetical protein